MKKIVCEMCEGTEFTKEEGMFVCQNCGTKYSPEEAKKIMVDVDDVKLLNLYERARKSLEVDDLKHAAEYYKQILDEKPNDWEAYFYSYLGEFDTFTNAQAGSVATKLGLTIPPAYDMAIENCDAKEVESRMLTITTQVVNRILGIAATGECLLRQYEGCSLFSIEGKVNSDMYQKIRPTAANTIVSCVLAFNPIEAKLEQIISDNSNIDKDLCKECLLQVRRARYNLADTEFEPHSNQTERLVKAELIHEYAKKINELDVSFEVPSVESKTNSSGCYVATCVYGSYDCPEVWTLRRFRDDKLAETWYGRAFIKTYYAISPTLVKWFGHTVWFKKLWRGTLDRMVKNLQEQGFEDTPYNDREW